MLDKQKNFINSLGEEIFNLYLNNGFSKVMKAQIDEKVFHAFLLTELSKIDDKKIHCK